MTVLVEDDLQLTLPSDWKGYKFDNESSHGLSHCMKAVDFIIETEDKFYFVEFKDPDNPKSTSESRKEFIEKLQSNTIDHDLKTKYRDSLLYELAEGRAKKPIYYLVLIGLISLSETDLMIRTESLMKQLPVGGPRGQKWKAPLFEGCVVMNVATWNKHMLKMPVTVSAT